MKDLELNRTRSFERPPRTVTMLTLSNFKSEYIFFFFWFRNKLQENYIWKVGLELYNFTYINSSFLVKRYM